MAIEKLKSENDALHILNDNLKEKILDLEEQVLILQNNSIKLIETLREATIDNEKYKNQITRMGLVFNKINSVAKGDSAGGNDEKINQG